MTHTFSTICRTYLPILVVLAVYFLFFAITDAQAQGSSLKNPLSADFSDIPKFIAGALRIMVMVALPIITFFFVYSGFLFIKAQGNPGELTKAKTNFVYVVIGALLILGAWIIATLISGTVTQLTGGI